MADSPQRIPVLLLKTKSTPADGYEEYFSTDPFTATFIPVLEHRPNVQNRDFLRSLLLDGKLGRHDNVEYGGMVFTSQRAVEGFANVVAEIEANNRSHTHNQAPAPLSTNTTNNSCSSSSPSTTPSFPLYVVGPATSRTLTALLATSSRSPHSTLLHLNPQVFGSHTGNGEALAHYILQHYHSLQGPTLPLLFLVGEQRRAIIPNTLMDPALPSTRQIRVDEHIIYETGVMESFAHDFASQRSQIEKDLRRANSAAVMVVVVVVFSPSGCEAMLRCLGYVDSANQLTERGKSRGAEEIRGQMRYVIATIGPSTRDYLKRGFQFEADVCAATPSPEGVGEGVKKFLGWKSKAENMTVG